MNLLFHPTITRWAVISSALLNVAGLMTALGAATDAFAGIFKANGPAIAGVCILLGICCTQIAGWGRSTIPSVDNNAPPKAQ